jgi:DNA-binding transcriptional regulator YiaG
MTTENTMTTEDTSPMTGAEFRIIREQLGLTNAWLTDHLKVAERSIVRWGDGERDVPAFAEDAMYELERTAAKAVQDGVASFVAKDAVLYLETYRTDAALQAAKPGDPYPASWHRAIAGRIREQVPGLTIEYADEPGDD